MESRMVLLCFCWQVAMSALICGHSRRPVPLKGWQSLDWVEKSMTGSPPVPVVIWNKKAMGMMSMLESGLWSALERFVLL